MGRTVSYQLHRDRVLDADERARLTALIATANEPPLHEGFGLQYAIAPRPDGVIAWGASKISFDLEDEATDRLLAALTALRHAIPDASCRAEDDHECVLWDDDDERYSADSGDYDPETTYVVWEAGAPSL